MANTFGGFTRLEARVRWAHGSLHDGVATASTVPVAIWSYRPPEGRPELGDEFLLTAKRLATIQHPLLPTILHSGFEGNEYFAVTEAPVGTPLTGTKADLKADDRTLARWGRDLALALQAMHSQGLVVRDLKSANLRVDPSGKLRWIGAGLSQFLGEPAPDYTSPEELRGEAAQVNAVSDVYSFGATLYEWLVGTPPFTGEAERVISQVRNANREAPPVRDTVPGVCPALEAIAAKALKKKQDERYPDAAAIAVDLQRLLNGDAVPLPMRIAGAPAFDCPACLRPLASTKRLCLYCNADTTVLKPDKGKAPEAPTIWLSDEGRTVPLPLVRAGLGCHTGRIVMSLLFVVVAIVGILASVLFDPSRSRSNDPPPILMVTLLALGVLVSLPPFIGLIGSALCLSTPAETRGRIYLILSLVLDLAALGLTAAPFAVEEIFARGSQSVRMAVVGASGLLQLLLGLLSWAFLLGFCGRLAEYLGRRAAQADASLFIRRGILYCSGVVLFPILGGFLLGCIGLALGVLLGDAAAGTQLVANLGVGLGALGAFFFLIQILRLSFEIIELFGVLRSGTDLLKEKNRPARRAKFVGSTR